MDMETRSRKRARDQSEDTGKQLSYDDLICPICLEIWKEVYVTVCGHSFCHRCILQSMAQTQQCPICKTSLPVQDGFHPNYSLNDVVAKYRQHASIEEELGRHTPALEEVLRLTNRFAAQDLQSLLSAIQKRMNEQEEKENTYKSAMVLDFLHRARQYKQQELATVQKQLATLEEDCSLMEAKLAPGGHEQAVSSSPSPSLPLRQEEPNSSEASSSSQQVALAPVTPADLAAAEVLSKRKLRVHSNFDEILQNYLETSSGPVGDPADRLGSFADSLDKLTCLSSFRELSALTYGDPRPSSHNAVPSIEFDKDGEFFAIAGHNKKITVFDYHSVLRNVGFLNHFPVQEMNCNARLSSVCYNPYHKSELVSSDYKGCVAVWDTNTGCQTVSYQEHNQRAWCVVYSPTDPTLFASGSDDCTVRIWCPQRQQQHSISTLPANASVCSVKFHPTNHMYLAYGCADHCIHYMDLRKPDEPLRVLRGHRKAVSYVQFISPTELVSASTDSELRLWNTELGSCVRTYKGHVNKKNFVGLTVNSNYIACGSENNAFYVYCKAVHNPMLEYKFSPDSSGSEDQQAMIAHFVSSVCFKKDTNIILAANSQSHLKILEMV